ncbi:MAG TPA: hypothetical protein PKD05_14070 [Candidatus Melainabacteria bacterium]|nr:hypothetical protein [Candidatus Melainabacteria bacterium]HMP52675.1 hypothetical protein [Candidatus Melainabacteria bacterium]
MIFDGIAIGRMKTKWEEAIADGRVSHVRMLPDGSILVHKSSTAELGGKMVADTIFDKNDSNDIATKAMLKITGPLEPDQVHSFSTAFDNAPWEEVFTIEVIRPMLEDGSFRKAVLLEDDSIDLYRVSKFVDSPQVLNFKGKEHIELILEITGPLKVGEVHEFKPTSE